MTHEHLPADVRRHLLAVANDEVTQGERDAVLDRAFAIHQQPAAVVRARWIVSPAAPFANRLARLALAAALLLAVSAIAIVVTGSARNQDPPPSGAARGFEGEWFSTDANGYNQMLVVGRGDRPAVRLIRNFAARCVRGDRGTEANFFFADGLGEVEANRLTVVFGRGACEDPLASFEESYTYVPGSDRLRGNARTVWERWP